MNDEMKNIFEPIENDPNFDELMKNFKLNCPVKKINLTVEEPNCIGGMYIISTDKLDLESLADMKDVEDNTLLFFTNQHVVELAKLFYGMLLLIAENKIVKKEDIFTIIVEYMNFIRNICTYDKYKNEITSIINRYFNIVNSNATTNFLSKFYNILNTIIFIPYNELDKIAQTAIDEFKKNMEESKNNE